jgi:hypothetical protein
MLCFLDSNYISKELEFDIETERYLKMTKTFFFCLTNYVKLSIYLFSLLPQHLSSTSQKFSTALDPNYISKELEFDIDNERYLKL